jgi:hypothetical protein
MIANIEEIREIDIEIISLMLPRFKNNPVSEIAKYAIEASRRILNKPQARIVYKIA